MEQNIILMILTNTIIVSIFYITIKFLSGVPARLRFYLCIAALLLSFTPWPFIKFDHPPAVVEQVAQTRLVVEDILPTAQLESIVSKPNIVQKVPILKAMDKKSSWEMLNTVYTLLLILSLIGLLLFCRDIIIFKVKLKQWLVNSSPANSIYKHYNYLDQNICVRYFDENFDEKLSPGMATGAIKSRIWLQKNINEEATVLLHEYIHTRQHDPRWLWLITFIQRLLWWNPATLAMCSLARKELELSCDEACDKFMAGEDYSESLLKILNSLHNTPSSNQVITNINMGKKFNIKRMENLMQAKSLNTSHYLCLAASLLMVIFVGTSVANTSSHEMKREQEHRAKMRKKNAYVFSEEGIKAALTSSLPLEASNAAFSLADQQKYNEAWKLLDQWSEDHAESYKKGKHAEIIFTARAFILASQGKYREIIKLYDENYNAQKTGEKVSDSTVITILARALAHTGKMEDAISILKANIKANPRKNKRQGLSHELGILYHVKGDYRKSIEAFENARDSDKKRFQAINYYKLGELEKADKLWQEGKYKWDNNLSDQEIKISRIHRVSYGTAQMQSRDKMVLMEADPKVFPYTPIDFVGLYGKDDIVKQYEQNFQWEKIPPLLEEIIKTNRETINANELIRLQILLAFSYRNSRLNELFLAEIDKLLDNPRLAEADRAHLLFTAATSLSQNNKQERAIEYLKQYETILGHPSRESTLLTGVIKQRAGDNEAALSILEPIMEEVEKEGLNLQLEVYDSVVFAYQKTDQLDKAIATQKKIIASSNPGSAYKQQLQRMLRKKEKQARLGKKG